MTDKAVLPELMQSDLRYKWFERHSVTYVIDKMISFAQDQGLQPSADGTYRKVLEGKTTYQGAVDVVAAFHSHVWENLRQYVVPREPPPITREEMIEWVKMNGTQTWFFNRLFKDDIAFSTFGGFFNQCKGASEGLTEKIITRIRDWYKEFVVKFDYWNARQDRFLDWLHKRREVKNEVCSRVRRELLAQHGEEQLLAEWPAMIDALLDQPGVSWPTCDIVEWAMRRFSRFDDTSFKPKKPTLDDVVDMFAELEADKVTAERFGPCPDPAAEGREFPR